MQLPEILTRLNFQASPLWYTPIIAVLLHFGTGDFLKFLKAKKTPAEVCGAGSGRDGMDDRIR